MQLVPIRELAKEVPISASALHRWCKRNGVETHEFTPLTPETKGQRVTGVTVQDAGWIRTNWAARKKR